jgi:integrase
MATIVKKAGNTRKPYTVRFVQDGKQRERSFATRKEAADFKAKFEHDSRESIFVDPVKGKVEFAAYAGEWINGHDASDGTKTNYRSVLNARIRPAFEGRTLASVAADRDGVQAFIAGMECSASRKAAALTVIVQAVTAAKASGRIAHHRLDGLTVKSDAAKPAEIIPATSEQLATLRAGLGRDGLVVDLMRGAGLRICEALAVNIHGFLNDGKKLRVSEQVLAGGKLGPLKHRKPGEYRDVPVPRWLLERVQAHVQQHGTDPDGYLFTRAGRRVTYKQVASRFATAAKAAKLTMIKRGAVTVMTAHHLRHAYASALLGAGVPITDLAAWLGHTDIRTTFGTYSHLVPDSWARGRDALESLAA